MRPKTLKIILRAREQQDAAQNYQCDLLWSIASGLGMKVPRFHELVKPKQDSGTAEDTIRRLRERLKKVAKKHESI